MMIRIEDKVDCCGCEACVQVCPKKCISFEADGEGFYYPKVNAELCIGCNLCNKVCPIINTPPAGNGPIACYAAINPDDSVVANSSSGGVFNALARSVIAKQGVVFGARFNDGWTVEHSPAATIDQLLPLMGSKYVQSRINDCFAAIKKLLAAGTPVLFCGTSCQTAALHTFLGGKPHENLLTVDLICHGVPSPGIWKRYIGKFRGVRNVSFRNKDAGWHSFRFKVVGEENYSNVFFHDPYMVSFQRNLSLRPSCYACRFKAGHAASDITLGDFWGIEGVMPEIDKDSGVSAVVINTPRGKALFEKLGLQTYPASFEALTRLNTTLVRSVPLPPQRKRFFRVIESRPEATLKVLDKYNNHMNPGFRVNFINFLRRVKHRLLR